MGIFFPVALSAEVLFMHTQYLFMEKLVIAFRNSSFILCPMIKS